MKFFLLLAQSCQILKHIKIITTKGKESGKYYIEKRSEFQIAKFQKNIF